MTAQKTNEELKAEIAELKAKLSKAKLEKKSARLETTKTANSFHIAVSQLFDTETLETRYSNYIIDNSETEIVFRKDMRTKLIADIKEKL